jgi:Tfp pilus assembly protein PilF
LFEVTVIAQMALAASLIAAPQSPTLASAGLVDATSHRDAMALFRTGQELLSAEKFDDAVTALSKSVDKDPLLSIAHYGLGQAYMNLRRFASAAKSYKDAIEALRRLHELGQSNQFEVEKQRDDEIKELKRLLGTTSSGASPLTAVRLEQRLRDLENQRTAIGGAFRPPAEILLALGSALFRNGEAEAAEANWKAAIEVNPKYGEAHNNLAVIYMQTGRLDEAEQEMKLAEKNGFRVNPQFRTDLYDRKKAAPKAP